MRVERFYRFLAVIAAGIAALLMASDARADMVYTFDTPTGATTSGGNVDAQAVFIVQNGELIIGLTDLQQNPTSVAQLISGISFTASGISGYGSVTTTGSGNVSTIHSGGTYSTATPDSLSRWDATQRGTYINLNLFSGGTPNRLIIGPDSAGGFSHLGRYSHANGSIINSHEPVVLGTAWFELAISGLTTNSQISHVVFQFGTTPGCNTVRGCYVPVPEPTTVVSGMLLLLPLGVQAFRTGRKYFKKS